MSKKRNPMEVLIDYLNQLSRSGAAYTIEHNSEDAIMVIVATLSERWEINFSMDGRIEAELFESKGFFEGEDILKKPLEFWNSDDWELDDEAEADSENGTDV